MAFVAVSIPMYIFSLDYTVTIGDRVFVQGFNVWQNRLWGVANDPNFATYISIITIFASMYMMYTHKKVWAYIVHGLNILLQLIYAVLTISRSGKLILFCVPVLTCIYPIISYIKKNKKKAVKSALYGICVSVALFISYTIILNVMPYAKKGISSIVSTQAKQSITNVYTKIYEFGSDKTKLNISKANNDKDKNKDEIVKISRNDEKEDVSNGRFARWRHGIAAFKTTPIIGTSPRNIAEILKERTTIKAYDLVVHCAYLEVLVGTGVLGAIAMGLCLLYVAFKFLKSTIKQEFDLLNCTVVACFFTGSIGAFFVSDVFFVFTINSFVFFYMLGYLYGTAEDNKSGVVYKIFTSIFKKRAAKEAQPSLKDSQDAHEC